MVHRQSMSTSEHEPADLVSQKLFWMSIYCEHLSTNHAIQLHITMSTHKDTEEDKSLISFAQSHPVAKRLLSLSDTILLREIYAVPKSIPRLNTTAGVLRGP